MPEMFKENEEAWEQMTMLIEITLRQVLIVIAVTSLIAGLVGGFYIIEARDSCNYFQSSINFEECLGETTGLIDLCFILVIFGGFLFALIVGDLVTMRMGADDNGI